MPPDLSYATPPLGVCRPTGMAGSDPKAARSRQPNDASVSFSIEAPRKIVLQIRTFSPGLPRPCATLGIPNHPLHRGVSVTYSSGPSQHSSVRALRIAIVLIVVSLGTMVLGAWIATFNQFWAGIIASLATALFTAVVIGVIYDLSTKQQLIQDVREASGLAQGIIESGLTRVVTDRLTNKEYQDILGNETELDIVPLRPLDWAQENMNWVLTLASSSDVSIRIYVPDPRLYASILSSLTSNQTRLAHF